MATTSEKSSEGRTERLSRHFRNLFLGAVALEAVFAPMAGLIGYTVAGGVGAEFMHQSAKSRRLAKNVKK